jgi:exoribonuclease R
MPSVPLKLTREAAQPDLVVALAAIRAELELPTGFPAEASAEAARAVDAYEPPDLDLADIPFVTIDPAGATDLDQALAIEPDGSGWRVF